ncbi:unnamed protein product [Albugo candida]|uniref:Uncharacterized protein n=1 Tax=Albugo candida TaxID=65357 RepID=A0A024GKR3_9STRA|nr:unnamed protein product [Albugo candida]|eukprot:CCI47324.1 unnamed protein product [Albugo candida]
MLFWRVLFVADQFTSTWAIVHMDFHSNKFAGERHVWKKLSFLTVILVLDDKFVVGQSSMFTQCSLCRIQESDAFQHGPTSSDRGLAANLAFYCNDQSDEIVLDELAANALSVKSMAFVCFVLLIRCNTS